MSLHPGASQSRRFVAPIHPPRPSGSDHFIVVLRNLPALVVLSVCAWVLIFWLGAPG